MTGSIYDQVKRWYTQNGISTQQFFKDQSTELGLEEMMNDFAYRMLKKEFELDAFGGWLIEKNCPTSVLERFRKARKA